MNIKGQSFLKLLDFTPAQIQEFLDLAADLKAGCADLRKNKHADPLLI